MNSSDLFDEPLMDPSPINSTLDANSTFDPFLTDLDPHFWVRGVLTNLSQLPADGNASFGDFGRRELTFGKEGVCTEILENKTYFSDNCMPLEDPLEMRKPHKANPSFVPIVITHALTFILGVSGNSVIVASMARERGTRNVTRWVCLLVPCSEMADCLFELAVAGMDSFIVFVFILHYCYSNHTQFCTRCHIYILFIYYFSRVIGLHTNTRELTRTDFIF